MEAAERRGRCHTEAAYRVIKASLVILQDRVMLRRSFEKMFDVFDTMTELVNSRSHLTDTSVLFHSIASIRIGSS